MPSRDHGGSPGTSSQRRLSLSSGSGGLQAHDWSGRNGRRAQLASISCRTQVSIHLNPTQFSAETPLPLHACDHWPCAFYEIISENRPCSLRKAKGLENRHFRITVFIVKGFFSIIQHLYLKNSNDFKLLHVMDQLKLPPRLWPAGVAGAVCWRARICEQCPPPALLSMSTVTSALGRGGWGGHSSERAATTVGEVPLSPDTSGVGPLQVGWCSVSKHRLESSVRSAA